MSGVKMLRSLGASAGAVQVMRMGLWDLNGDGPAAYSGLWLLIGVAGLRGHGGVLRIRGGNDLLPRAFVSRLQGAIHYGWQLTAIQRATDRVEAVFRVHGGKKTERRLTADYLVCAIPFPLLRDVRVSPRFSRGKRLAIARLPNGSALRVFLQMRERFWERNNLSGTGYLDSPPAGVFPAYARQHARGVLEYYCAGREAERLAMMSEAGRVARALAQVARVHPEAPEYFEGGRSIAWSHVRTAAGAFAWYRPGMLLGLLPHVATPEGRVVFAGDQTTLRPGWMDGALESGLRAAEQIQRAAR
jgi:monoamine oxidase